MMCFAVTATSEKDTLNIIKMLTLYEVWFKTKHLPDQTKIIPDRYLFIVPHKINKQEDYRLCEMYFQMNYRQVPQSGSYLHFHGRI